MPKPDHLLAYDLKGNTQTITPEGLVWRPAAYAFIVDDNEQLLVLQNTYSGKYDFPGGGVELYESLPEALHREVWEETGLEVDILKMVTFTEKIFVSTSGKKLHALSFFYLAKPTGGALRSTILEDEVTVDPIWKPIAELTPDHFTYGRDWRVFRDSLAL